MAVFLFCTCFLFMGITQKANAAMDYSYDWGFGILGAIDGTTGAELEAAPVGSNDYILNGNSVIVVNAYVSDAYPGYCYVRVDGNYVGNSTDAGLDYADEDDGNVHYNAFIIENLTPGNHTIEARADRPWNLGFNYGPIQKIDTINVTVSQATNTKTNLTVSQATNTKTNFTFPKVKNTTK